MAVSDYYGLEWDAPRVLDNGGAVHNMRHARFGARGNGTADDTQAFLDAIDDIPSDGKRTYVIPRGDYLIASTPLFSRSNVAWVGEVGTRLIVDNPDGGLLLRPIGTEEDRISNIVIRGIEFHDPDPAAHIGSDESHGIGAVYVDGLWVENCMFSGIGDESLEINRCTRVFVRGCRFSEWATESGLGSAVAISSSKEVLVIGNDFRESGDGDAIRLEAAEAGWDIERIRLIGNNIQDCTGQGITVVPSSCDVVGLTIANNQLTNVSGIPIQLAPQAGQYVYDAVIQGNTVYGGGADAPSGGGVHRGGIFASGDRVVAPLIQGNHVREWGATVGHHGICAVGATIVGNVVEDAPDSGIRDTGAAVIQGNTALRCGLAIESGARAGIQYGPDSLVEGNRCDGNEYGVYSNSAAISGGGSLVQGNTLTNNVDRGEYLNGDNYSRNNIISGNGVGIQFGETGDPISEEDILLDNDTDLVGSGTYRSRTGDVVTEAQGTDEISGSVSTSVAVTHGLSRTPDIEDISITPIGEWHGVSQFWVRESPGPNSSSFAVLVDAPPGEGEVFRFRWSIGSP